MHWRAHEIKLLENLPRRHALPGKVVKILLWKILRDWFENECSLCEEENVKFDENTKFVLLFFQSSSFH